MNKVRRKNLQAIIDQLEELKGSLEALQAEEEEYRDNIPENTPKSCASWSRRSSGRVSMC